MKDITLVIPAKNESESLPKVLNELSNYDIKKIVVIPPDDIKTKDSIKDFDCKILPQKGIGFGNALIQGISQVETKYFCIFNADGSFNPKYLEKLIDKLNSNIDFVFCSRYEDGGGSDDDTILTYVGNKFFTTFCNFPIFSISFEIFFDFSKRVLSLDLDISFFSFSSVSFF